MLPPWKGPSVVDLPSGWLVSWTVPRQDLRWSLLLTGWTFRDISSQMSSKWGITCWAYRFSLRQQGHFMGAHLSNSIVGVQNPKGLCCDSLPGACRQHHVCIFPTTDTSNTIKVHWVIWPKEQDYLHCSLDLLWTSFMPWAPLRTIRLPCHLTHPLYRCSQMWSVLPLEPSDCASCSVVGDERCDSLYFTQEGLSQNFLTAGLLKTLLKGQVPESAQDLGFSSWRACVLPRPPECQPLLAHPIQPA